jgi:hypothetical protein
VEALAHSLTLFKVVHGFWVPMSLAFSGSRCDVIDKLCAQQLEVGRQAGRQAGQGRAGRLLVTNSSVLGSNSRVEFNTQQQTPN